LFGFGKGWTASERRVESVVNFHMSLGFILAVARFLKEIYLNRAVEQCRVESLFFDSSHMNAGTRPATLEVT
jgi:hypothetical protein